MKKINRLFGLMIFLLIIIFWFFYKRTINYWIEWNNCIEYNWGAIIYNCSPKKIIEQYDLQKNYENFFSKEYDNYVKNTIKDNYTNSAINISLIQDHIINPISEEWNILFWIENNWHIHLKKENIEKLREYNTIYPIFAKINNLEELDFYQHLYIN